MAFFGLTALGPQNCFEYVARSSTHIFIFENKDFETAWKRIRGNSKTCEQEEQMYAIFKVLYRGPVPDNDKQLLGNAFSHLQAPYSFDDFMYTLIDLRDRKDYEAHAVRNGPGPSCDFRDSTELQSAIRKNKTSDRTLHDKQTAPLISSQEVITISVLFFKIENYDAFSMAGMNKNCIHLRPAEEVQMLQSLPLN
jgi:hypothetical protein